MDLDGVWELVKKTAESLNNTDFKEINDVKHPPKELSWNEFLSMYMSGAYDTGGDRLVKKGYDHDDTFLGEGTHVEVKDKNGWRKGEYRGFKEVKGVKMSGWMPVKKPNDHIILFSGKLETLHLKDKKWNYGITVTGFALLFWIWENWGDARKKVAEQAPRTRKTQSGWYKAVIEELKKMWVSLDSGGQKKKLETVKREERNRVVKIVRDEEEKGAADAEEAGKPRNWQRNDPVVPNYVISKKRGDIGTGWYLVQ